MNHSDNVSDADQPNDEDEEDELIRAANDHFFQAFYGIEDASHGFFEPTILPELSGELDWQNAPMELIRGLFVDPRLHFNSSDLLWKVQTKTGDDAFILVSCDHQTRPDKWMVLRCLHLQTLAQFRILSEDEGKPKSGLPVIYCIVLYQGTEVWNCPLEYSELINWAPFPEEFREKIEEFTPRFRYHLVPLQSIPDEELPSHEITRLGLTLMKAALLHKLADWVRENRSAFPLLLQRDDGESILVLMFNYAAQKVRNKEELHELNVAIETLDEPSRKTVMNGARIIRAEGKAEVLIASARRMLDREFEPETIADVLEVSIDLITSLKTGEKPDLEAWIDEVTPRKPEE